MVEENEIPESRPKKILMIGICGGLAQITTRLILQDHPDWQVLGVDTRDTSEIHEIKGLKVEQMRFSRGNFEKLFRDNTFDIVFHLARISHSKNTQNIINKRLELSVMGTSRILDLCLRFNVKKVVVLSTFHVYGAYADNSVFLSEEAPLKASIAHPELRDVVEMDQICTNWMWKYQNQLTTVVLRPCNIIGSQIQNSMSKYLVGNWALKPIDFNPIFQFIHEFDMAQVLYRSIEELPTGIYNIATDEYISLRDALDIIGSKGIPFPMTLATPMNNILKMARLEVPDYLIDYLKFSCLIDNSNVKKYLGPDFFRFKMDESLNLLRLNS